jgi:hypothetical protein
LPIFWPIFWPVLRVSLLAAALALLAACDSSAGDADGGTDGGSDADTGIDDHGIGFQCATPDDLLDPQSDTYAIVKASGRYNDCMDLGTEKEPGIGTLEEWIGGVELSSDYQLVDIGRHESAMFAGSEHHLHITFWDKPEDLGELHTRQDYGVVFIDADALPGILAEDRNYLELYTEYTFQHAFFEERLYEGDSWYKQCTITEQANAPASSLFMCHEGVQAYDIGETLSVVGLIHTQLLEEDDTNCVCIKNTVEQSSCAEYDALPTEL